MYRLLMLRPFPLKEGAFAIAVKSKYFPGECVASRRSSPLLVAIKTKTRLATDHIPILYGKGKRCWRNKRSYLSVESLLCYISHNDISCLLSQYMYILVSVCVMRVRSLFQITNCRSLTTL